MNDTPVILFGLGFTAVRLARRLLGSGRSVFAATRNPERFSELASLGLVVSNFDSARFPSGAVVGHTIPPVNEPDQSVLRDFLRAISPRRIVYVSATSVYGDLVDVSRDSAVVPSGESSIRRFADEQWLAAGPWESLILRAAAIYGPGRGAHRRLASAQTAPFIQRRGPSGLVSRIHVDDLARLMERGLDSSLCGAWPVADGLPCSTEEVLRWSAEYLNLDVSRLDISGTVSTGRRVDGSDIFRALEISAEYPDYRSGIAHCIREEGWAIRPGPESEPEPCQSGS